MRHALIGLTVCVAAGAVGYLAWSKFVAPATIPFVEHIEVPTGGKWSQDHAENTRTITNLLNKRAWTAEDVDFAASFIHPWMDEPIPDESDMQRLEAFIETDLMFTGVVERMAAGVEHAPEVTGQVYASIQKMLKHPQAHQRRSGIAHASTLGLIESNTQVRAIVARAAELDPDPGVRRIAEIKLQFAETGEPGEPCPTCPGGVRP